ncbi:MAG: response regulator, partial [Gemmataceae bacterium]
LPGMTGPELAKRLAEQLTDGSIAQLHKRPVLFMSGFAPEAALEHGLPIEMENFLQKPFTPQELLEAIRSRLAKN